MRTALDAIEQLARVVGVDRLFRLSEDRGVDACGEGDTERVVRRDRHDACGRSDEQVEVVRIARDDIGGRVMTEEGGFEHADTGGHIARRAVIGVFEIPPFRVLTVEDAFQPDGQ